ncbi:Subtilase family protein [Prunus dulcis]|uniref:Subtilase family protein n=1 Tax=Prunus dulcis TaxID=3755 RepID=A0A5H2XNL4_PRUDU|nr:Subtilase family protein [Prunus dulcis]
MRFKWGKDDSKFLSFGIYVKKKRKEGLNGQENEDKEPCNSDLELDHDSGSTVIFTDGVCEDTDTLYVAGVPTLVSVRVYFTVVEAPEPPPLPEAVSRGTAKDGHRGSLGSPRQQHHRQGQGQGLPLGPHAQHHNRTDVVMSADLMAAGLHSG